MSVVFTYIVSHRVKVLNPIGDVLDEEDYNDTDWFSRYRDCKNKVLMNWCEESHYTLDFVHEHTTRHSKTINFNPPYDLPKEAIDKMRSMYFKYTGQEMTETPVFGLYREVG